MAKGKAWELSLDSDQDFAILRIVVERGRVTEFALTYRAVIGDDEVDVLRYDTCDGHLHVHRMWLDEPNDRLALESTPAADYTHELERAKRDLFRNWKSYRAQMELKK